MLRKYLILLLLTALLTACIGYTSPPAPKHFPGTMANERPELELITTVNLPIRAEQALFQDHNVYFTNFGLTFGGAPTMPFIAALDVQTNKLLWQANQRPWISLAIDDQNLFILLDDGISAFSLPGRLAIWQSPIHCDKYSNQYVMSGCIGAEILAKEGKVFFAAGHLLYSMNAKDGSVLWTYVLPHGIDSFKPVASSGYEDEYRALAYAGDILYARTGYPWQILAIDANTGKELWKFSFDIPDWKGESPPGAASRIAFSEQAIYFGTFGNKRYALDRKTGSILWEKSGAMDEPLYHNGLIIAVTDYQTVGGIDAQTGDILWSVPFIDNDNDIGDLSPFVIHNGYLIFYAASAVSNDIGQITAIDLKTGEVVYTLRSIFPKDCAPSLPTMFSFQNENLYLATIKCLHTFRLSLRPGSANR